MPSDGVLSLRPLRPSDAQEVIAHLQDPEIPRWTLVPSPYGREQFDAWLERSAAARASGEGLHFAIADGDDRVIGAVGAHGLDGPRPDIGYWVAAPARRRGVAARAVTIMRDHLAALGHAYLEILVHPDNAPSQRVATAGGFRATGECRPCPRDGLAGDYMVFAWPADAVTGAG